MPCIRWGVTVIYFEQHEEDCLVSVPEISGEILTRAPLSLLPVLLFLASLKYLDGYKLTRLSLILNVIVLGIVVTTVSYYSNWFLIGVLQIEFLQYARYIAPIVEEVLKAAVVVYLFRSNRIGFLTDAAILGFAVGTGFAITENIYYLYQLGGSNVGTWIIRGFGTAIMHGGVTAIFAVMTQALTERHTRISPSRYLPGLAMAILLHSIFNHFPGTPVLTTLGTLIVLPVILTFVYGRSNNVIHEWLEVDFDVEEEWLELIREGKFTHSKAGGFLLDLSNSFDGATVADMLCYIRLHTELSLRAKSVLMAREFGTEIAIDRDVRDKLMEMDDLRKSIGNIGFVAMAPYFRLSRKELWELFMLKQ
jgi:RsiW-degrading membrane proteinase PrsW (M82 family)